MTYTFSKRLSWARSLITIYTTTRVVKIQSKTLAITYLALMVIVWAAFLRSYQLDLKRIYQKSCEAKGVVLLKVKGVISTEDYTDEELGIPEPALYRRVWDTEDLMRYYGDGFFITSNVIITANQTRGRCGQVTVLIGKINCIHNRGITDDGLSVFLQFLQFSLILE